MLADKTTTYSASNTDLKWKLSNQGHSQEPKTPPQNKTVISCPSLKTWFSIYCYENPETQYNAFAFQFFSCYSVFLLSVVQSDLRVAFHYVFFLIHCFITITIITLTCDLVSVHEILFSVRMNWICSRTLETAGYSAVVILSKAGVCCSFDRMKWSSH